MKKFLFFWANTLLISLSGQESASLGDRIIIGSSVTYIWDTNDTKAPINYYKELTWTKNISVNLNKNFYAGLNYQNIYTSGASVKMNREKEKFSIVGIFANYDFWPKKKKRLFLETSLNYGNYCTCGQGDPYRRKGLIYLGWGGGYDMPLLKNISLDLSFMSYPILNNSSFGTQNWHN